MVFMYQTVRQQRFAFYKKPNSRMWEDQYLDPTSNYFMSVVEVVVCDDE